MVNKLRGVQESMRATTRRESEQLVQSVELFGSNITGSRGNGKLSNAREDMDSSLIISKHRNGGRAFGLTDANHSLSKFCQRIPEA